MVKADALDKVLADTYFYSGKNFLASTLLASTQLKFDTFFHSHVAEFIKGLNRKGVPGLLNLSNQTLGNPYLHSPWKFGYTLSALSTGSACFIEGGFNKIRNQIASDSQPGNFEAVVLQGTNLWHYSQDNSNIARPWKKGQLITSKAISPGCIAERTSNRNFDSNGKVIQPGNFDVVVLESDGGLHHYTRDNSNSNNPWQHQGIITTKATGPGCIIQSNFSDVMDTIFASDVIVSEGSDLWHYRKNDNSNQWFKVQNKSITDKATGPGCIIQSSFVSGAYYSFELVALEGSQLVHYSMDHAKNEWNKISTITDSATSPGWIIQSGIKDSYWHGNFEVIVCEGNQLVHYWKDNSDPGSRWRRGQIISTKASAQGCIINGSFSNLKKVGNFEVLVPEENGRLVHYYHVNEGNRGTEAERFYFRTEYEPTLSVDDPYPRHDIDFSHRGAYSLYNWEIFFHVPMLLASQLSKNQLFADAMRWYHYIFDPTDDSHELTTHRYWKLLPFRDTEKQRIDHMLEILADPSKIGSPERLEIEDQLDDWAKHPFQPHHIARLRLIAYQKNVIMKYIDNVLIAWGDQLFRQDTIESINEATQLYVLAASILGPRPQHVPRKGKIKAQTYAQLIETKKLDAFGIIKQELENEFPYASSIPSVQVSDESTTSSLLGIGDTFYFCIPQNDKLLSYWDTVADRLFKIRNCMNIEGVVRQLPLFEPPIEPALLVQAAARGVDIRSVLSDLSAALPHYRFSYMLQKALEVCSELKALGAALLSALEKKDAEALASVRARHETEILDVVLSVKENQYEEAKAAKAALESSRGIWVSSYVYYQKMLGEVSVQEPKLNEVIDDAEFSKLYSLDKSEGDLKLTNYEKNGLDLSDFAASKHDDASYNLHDASDENAVPDFSANIMPIGIGVGSGYGGSKVAAGSSSDAGESQAIASTYSLWSAKAGILGAVMLRGLDYVHQNNVAAKNIMNIDKQIATADIRTAITYQELQNHKKQIENAKDIEEFLRNKYTNEELYIWMQGNISAIYFQCYQFAYDLAKRAERCYRFEMGVTKSDFIQFGYWDNLNKGLLAGERLYFALKQMEQAYYEQNKREYEITKNISLVLHDPMALIKLKQTGQCLIELPEALFDADYPGHYMRRIKSASLTIPCVVGPYTSINCTLTLLTNKIRIDNNAQTDYTDQEEKENGGEEEEDPRFVTNFATLQSIATSHAQNDSGMFELNFRDERYLPFEGAGVISRWRIDMPRENNAFDFNTISDVIIKLNYMAREGGELLRQKAMDATSSVSPKENLGRMFSIRHEFPNEWHRFLNPSDVNATTQTLKIDLIMERFPFLLRGKNIQINKMGLFLNFKDISYNTEYQSGPQPLAISVQSEPPINLDSNPALKGMPSKLLPDFQANVPGFIQLTIDESNIKNIASKLQHTVGSHQRLNSDVIEDLLVVCWYSAQ